MKIRWYFWLVLAIPALSQQQAPLALKDFEPRSMLKVPAHPVERAKFPAIDFHSHLVGGEAEAAIRAMDAANMAVAVNFSGGSGERLRQQIARFTKWPGRVVTFANVDFGAIDDPGFPEQAARQLEQDARAGARGLKIFKSLDRNVKDRAGKLVAVDDPRLDPLWRKAGEMGIPVAIHTSDPDAFFVPTDRFNERWDELQRRPEWSFHGPPFPPKAELLAQRNRVIARHPRTIFVGLHIANHPEDLGEVEQWMDRFPNLNVEVAARLNELGRQPYSARKFFLKFADRILFGIDGAPDEQRYRPYFRFLETYDEYFDYAPRPGQGRWRIYGIGLPDEVLKKVYWSNAARLLKLPSN